MTRWFWRMTMAAVILASGAGGTRAGCEPTQTKADTPAPVYWCEGGYCAPCQPCCSQDCCKGCCCKKGCCAKGEETKTVTVTAPVVILRLAGNPTVVTAPPCLMPQPGGPVPPPMSAMPCPTACPALGCPMACPPLQMPPPPPMPAPGQEPRGYRVRVKTVEACPGEEDIVTACPVMMVPEGTRFSVCFDSEAVLGNCGRARAVDCPAPGTAWPCRPGKPGGVVQVQVSGEQDGRVRLNMDVQQSEVDRSGKEGIQTMCRCLHVERPVTLGKTARVVLDRGPDGTARRWLEVGVKREDLAATHPVTRAQRPEVLPAPKKVEYPDDGSFLSALGEFALEVVAECFGCQTWSNGMTLPEPRYLEHPPQYFPPSPPFPLTRELATQEAVASTPAMQCNQASTWAVQPCAATSPVRTPPTVRISVLDGESRLEVSCDGLRLACKKFDLKVMDKEPMTLTAVDGQVALKCPHLRARANVVTTDQKDTLVLEGHVKVHYAGDGQNAEVSADRIEVLGDGSLKIKP